MKRFLLATFNERSVDGLVLGLAARPNGKFAYTLLDKVVGL